MNRGTISNFLRRLKLLYVADFLRFYAQKIGNRHINREFKKNNPQVKLPPDYLLYESFLLNYSDYYFGGQKGAMWLTEHLTKHCDLKNKKILDWGCGPGRIIRHLPNVIGNGCNYYATDYNKKSVEWCSANLPGINFNQNTIDAKLPYEDNFFDVIYGISVFTHLSLQQHYEWYKELFRVLNDGGIFFFTTQGENFKGKLTNKELNKFEKGELVVRGNVKEGHRTFSAFHSIKFMQHLFSNVAILAHVRPAVENEEAPSQDIWIARKISTYNNK